MSERHAPWCARFMACTCMAPGGPSTSAAERISWLMQRYEEGRKACEMVVNERNALRAENERLKEAVREWVSLADDLPLAAPYDTATVERYMTATRRVRRLAGCPVEAAPQEENG